MDTEEVTREQILAIPQEKLPLLVVSRNLYSHLATEIVRQRGGPYNHYMMMIHPKKVASQDLLFREIPINNYLKGEHLLKLWSCPYWLGIKRQRFIREIEEGLKKPWWLRGYDWLQILGYKLHLEKWIQLPILKVCSSWGDKIRILDSAYDLDNPTPEAINEWCKTQQGYKSFKFIPD